MWEFEAEADLLRAKLEDWIDGVFKLSFDTFLHAGCDGIHQIHVDGITRENSTFADHITAPGLYVPKDVIKAMCLGAAFIGAAVEAHEQGNSFAVKFLIDAAEEVGFCSGAAFAVMHEDERSRAEKSINGKKGALSLHGPRTELKNWALAQAKSNRGAHKDIARKLASQIPEHLVDVSKDPERLIYDALRAPAKPS